MTSPLVLARIDAWEADGIIDAATARRLREAEAAGPVAAQEIDPPPAASPTVPAGLARHWGPGITAGELFAYLGAAFILGSWYALVGSMAPPYEVAGGWYGAAAIVAAIALATAGVLLRPRDPRARRAAGVAFAATLPNLGAGIYVLVDQVRPEDWTSPPANLALASALVVVAAVAARRLLPAVLTQLALAISAGVAAAAALGWLDPVVFSRGVLLDDPAALDVTTALIRVVLTLGWWWMIALGMAALLVVGDPQPRTDGRTLLGRLAVGLTAVLGTTAGVFIRHDWNAPTALADKPVLVPFAGAAILLAVSGVLVWLAVRRTSVGYLWPGGLGVFIALTWMNAEYLAGESGLWVALLAEGMVLFGVAIGMRAVGRRLRPEMPGTLPG